MGNTNTAAVIAGGTSGTPNTTEEYNSSTTAYTAAAWASAPSINTGRRGMQNTGIGSATAGLIVGGVTGPGPTVNKTEEYDGSSWTETGNYPTNLKMLKVLEYKPQHMFLGDLMVLVI